MQYRVFVDGQDGTTGLRIHDYLSRRADIDVLRIDADRRKDAVERARLLNAADVAFLCLPDDAARQAVSLVDNPRTCVIDASTAHRTLPGWAFGLPELAPGQRDKLRASKRIANPGCHASAFILLVRPLVDAGLIPPAFGLTATSITGYSGGGKKMIEQYEQQTGSAGAARGGSALSAPRPYALSLNHKHVPEMTAHSALSAAPLFMPMVGNFYKGLSVTVPLQLAQLPAVCTPDSIQAVYTKRYAGERFINVMPLNDGETLQGGFFDVQAANDTNRVDIFVFGHGAQVLLMARLDNLGKGASGAAVQSMNLHLGADEAAGLA